MDHLRYYAAMRKIFDDHGLSQRNLVTLLIVHRDGTRSVGYLRHIVGCLPSMMSRALSTLEEKRFVKRKFGKDRRCVHVNITEPGSKVAEECLRELDAAAGS